MEDNKTNGSSDRDKKMMGSFESYADKSDDKDEKDSKKSKKESARPVFERATEDTKAEKNQREEDNTQAEQLEAAVVEALSTKPEELVEGEAQQIVEQYAEARAEDLRQDLAESEEDSVEEAVALANAALIESIQESEPTTEEELDAVLAETIEELGLEDTSAEAEDSEEDEDDTTATTTPTVTPAPPTPTPPVPPAPRPPVPPVPPTPVPPTPPAPPTPPVPPIGLPIPGPNTPAPSPNIMPNPTAASANVWTPKQRAGDMLLGAAVGYLLGRRRGRIKAEARLEPIQEKLEDQVKSLHDQVAERETKIRKLAAEKVTKEPETARPLLINKIEERVQRRMEKAAEATPIAAERTMPAVEQVAQVAERQMRPIMDRRPEGLGRFALPRTEIAIPMPERAVEAPRKDIETMTMPELLAVADRIERNGVSVKEMYENGRLNAEGLRRIVKEFLQGDHLDRVLAENLRPLESYEGEPLRQAQQQSTASGGPQTNASTTLTTLPPVSSPVPQAPAEYTPPPTETQPAGQPKTGLSKSEYQTAVGIGLLGAGLIIVLLILFSR